MNYLENAFKKLSIIDEDVFELDKEGITDLKDFIDDGEEEVDDTVEVIDTEADNEEELEDSYIGKVILDCSVCHSKIFEDADEVELSEDGEIANVGEECPYCYSTDGFTVIGEVKEYCDNCDDEKHSEEEHDDEKSEEEKDEDEKDEEEVEVEVKDKEKFESVKRQIRKSLKESQKASKRKSVQESLSYGEVVAIQDEWEKFKKRKGIAHGEADDAWEFIETECKGVYDTDEEKDEVFSLIGSIEEGSIDEGCKGRKCKKPVKEARKTSLRDRIDAEADDKKERAKKAFDKAKDDADSDRLYRIKKHISAREGKSLKEAPVYGLNPKFDSRKSFYGKAQVDTGDKGDKNRLYSYDTLVAEIIDGKPVIHTDNSYFVNGRYSPTTMRHIKDWLKQLGFKAETSAQMIADYASKNECVKESIESISVDTGDQIIDVTAKDKEEEVEEVEETGEEVLAPLSDETKDEIVTNTEDDESEENVDMEIDDFSEESFDDLGEKYFKEAYKNIIGYKTTNVFQRGNKLKVEGVIKFSTGKSKKTSFMFEASQATRDGKASFLGENKEISNGTKAFTLIGSLNSGKFLSESLAYNYKTNSRNIKGTVTR